MTGIGLSKTPKMLIEHSERLLSEDLFCMENFEWSLTCLFYVLGFYFYSVLETLKQELI